MKKSIYDILGAQSIPEIPKFKDSVVFEPLNFEEIMEEFNKTGESGTTLESISYPVDNTEEHS